MYVTTLDPKMIDAVTGDLTEVLQCRAREIFERNSNSIRAYAMFSVLREIHSLFEDEQGIPTVEALKIDRSLLSPIRQLLEEGLLQRGEIPSDCAIEAMLVGVAALQIKSEP
jgi:hypothetical protein